MKVVTFKLSKSFVLVITSVKCIPHGFRLAFSQALKTVLYKVVSQPNSVDAWVRLLLLSRCTLQVCRPKNRQERRSGNRKSLQQSSILKSLATWGKDDGITTLVKSILDGSGSVSFGQGGAEIDSVFVCIKSLPKGTSCGRDGLRAQHILDALCGEGSATVTDLLKAIMAVVNLWLARRCPPILAEFVASAPLMSLLKPDNGIRPIAVGTIWRRLVSKVAMKGVGKEMLKYLSDFQFGVGVSGGAEAILHSANRLLSEYHNDGSLAMLTVDFSNAFNLVDRSSLLQEIRDSCKLILHAWYLDDITIIGDLEEVSRVLDIIKLREGLFPVDIRRPSLGVKLLGRAVSKDADFISGVATRRVVNAVDLMSLLPRLHDPHSDLLLLRSCMGISKLFFSLRTCLPVHMEESALFSDKSLCRSIENIVVSGGSLFGDLQWWLASLPIRLGGSGLYSAKVVSSYAFVASMTQSWVLKDDILRDSGICGVYDDYVSTLACLRGKHACVDLTGVSPLVGLSGRGFTVGHAALKTASCKVTKHEKACIENQHVFIPFVFDTFGFLAPEAVELLNRIQRVKNSNVMTPRSTNMVFHRISFVIQKGVVAQLVACLPSTTM
ncbi:hypothetical protein Tco_1239821 [Tanacetum coccineum]